MGAASISLGEPSYPPTRQVIDQKGILPMLEKRQVRVIDFDDLPADDWVDCRPADDASTGLTASLKAILARERQAH